MENKHQRGDLQQMQAVSLRGKIAMTKDRIRSWYEYWDGNVYASFSGGKDSTVLKHIVDSMYSDVPSVFINTGLEFPEIQQFVRSQPNTEIIHPKRTFKEILETVGYPVISKEVANCVESARSGGTESRRYRQLFGTDMYNGKKSIYNYEKWSFLYDAPFDISDRCCHINKKAPSHQYEMRTGRKKMVATMAEESRLREASWIKYGCNAFDMKTPRSAPMSFWTEQDVLHYIKEFDVPYCSVYGDIVAEPDDDDIDGQISLQEWLGVYKKDDILCTTGLKRTGCIFCMFGCHLEKEPNRFQKLKETHPKHYDYCIKGGEMVDGKWKPNKDGLGLGFVLDYIGVKY